MQNNGYKCRDPGMLPRALTMPSETKSLHLTTVWSNYWPTWKILALPLFFNIPRDSKEWPPRDTHMHFSSHLSFNSIVIFVAPLGKNQRQRVGGPGSCLDWREQTTVVAYHWDWLLTGKSIDNFIGPYRSVTAEHPPTNWWPPW